MGLTTDFSCAVASANYQQESLTVWLSALGDIIKKRKAAWESQVTASSANQMLRGSISWLGVLPSALLTCQIVHFCNTLQYALPIGYLHTIAARAVRVPCLYTTDYPYHKSQCLF